jgi:glycosyltransferase involved in cell wall biosynthesis
MKTTLLITTFNRSHLLRNSLSRLCNLTIPDEVMIVDDGGTDDTKGVCDDFSGRLPIRYIYNNNPEWTICSMARNIGVKNCIGDIIITSEPELLFVTDIVKQMVENHDRYPNQVISAGIIYHAQEKTQFNQGLITDPFTALKDEIVEDYQTEPRSYHPSGYCKTKNMQATFTALYEKKWLMELGGWDEEFKGAWGWDDIELCTRLRINGINQHICPEMEALHQWHPHLPPHLMGQASSINERYMISKRLDLMERGDIGLVANKDKKWGVIK